MVLNRFNFSAGALVACCFLLTVVSVPSNAYAIDEKTQAGSGFEKLFRAVDYAFSDERLQCKSNTAEAVKGCLRRVIIDLPNLSTCSALNQIDKCVVGGFYQCANGYGSAISYLNTVKKDMEKRGCIAGTEKSKISAGYDDDDTDSFTRRKRTAEIESEISSRFEIMEAGINQNM